MKCVVIVLPVLFLKSQRDVSRLCGLISLYNNIIELSKGILCIASCKPPIYSKNKLNFPFQWTFNNSRMQLHRILKFGSFLALLDLLNMYQNLFVQMSDTIFTIEFSTIHFLREAIKVQYLFQLIPKLVMEPNHTYLLTLLLSPLIIWLTETLILLNKNPVFILSCFS